jgi:hypothetical protein
LIKKIHDRFITTFHNNAAKLLNFVKQYFFFQVLLSSTLEMKKKEERKRCVLPIAFPVPVLLAFAKVIFPVY